ncbi:MAG: MoxR family ATPase [Chrysiogenetes bacterium]|nr:MoxR family ATPase [Chrysiogenetes bacterium]
MESASEENELIETAQSAPEAQPETPASEASTQPPEAVKAAAKLREDLLAQIRKKIVGQGEVVDLLVLALLAQGHGLFIGVPGLAKTRLISTLAEAIGLKFNRIQFTPDLMPADITGTEILEEDKATGQRHFRFVKGPVFANILLADEINRTSPKTQAALLQSMQEYKVSAGGQTHTLEAPFLVFATQNPIEQEGTYPLPEAQLDRFMFSIHVDYPSLDEEVQVVASTTGAVDEEITPVITQAQLLEMQKLVREVPVAEPVVRYAVALVRATRPDDESAPEDVKKWVAWGAGPRASQYLILGGKARALTQGRTAVTVADVRALAGPVLRHRVVVNFQAEAEGVNSDTIIAKLLEHVPGV